MRAVKRGGGQQFVSFDELLPQAEASMLATSHLSDVNSYDVAWASSVVARAWKNVRDSTVSANLNLAFDLTRERFHIASQWVWAEPILLRISYFCQCPISDSSRIEKHCAVYEEELMRCVVGPRQGGARKRESQARCGSTIK